MVDPVQLGIPTSGQVVIDIDLKELLQPAQARPFKPIALKQNHCIVWTVDAQSMANAFGSREVPINRRNSVGGHQIGALAHLFEEHAHREHTAYGISVRTGVRANEEPITLAQDV
jgi:hypothetical protein